MAKNKVKKRDFSKAKEKALKILKISAKVIVAIIGIAALLAFVVVPFLHSKINDVVAKFVWYPSCVLFVVSAVATVFKKPKTPSKYPIFDFLGNLGLVPMVVIFSSAFLINYYDTAYTWWWAAFVLVALFLPIFVFGVRSFLKKEKEYTEDQIKTSLKVCWKYVGFYWLMDLFYMAIFNYWTDDEQSQTLWLTLQFVFGGLAMVYIFYNLTRAFLSNAQKHWWGLLQDFLWGIAITVYLIFLIPDDALQTIVLSITAAVYGGLLTLVGVAWTIKDTNEKRKDDLKRAEQEKREDERLRYRPFVNMFAGPYQGLKTDIQVANWLKSTNDISTVQTKKLSVATFIRSCYFGNTDFSNFYVWGLKINEHITSFDSIRYIKKSSYFFLDFSQQPIYTEKAIESFSLVLEDMLENLYELKLEFEFNTKTGQLIIGGNNPTVWIGKAKHNGNCDCVETVEQTSHSHSKDKKKWLF